jgi:hypothetical protein
MKASYLNLQRIFKFTKDVTRKFLPKILITLRVINIFGKNSTLHRKMTSLPINDDSID